MRLGTIGKQMKQIAVVCMMWLVQGLFLWMPVKQNRVMVYVHNRKGFTCNPKYIVQKLLEMYKDRLEIIWVSMYPETCQEIRDMGIRVVLAESGYHRGKYLRTRVYITNDSFPAWAVHRKQQLWINTWHGAMNYKHIGLAYLAPMGVFRRQLFRLKNRQPDYFLAGSEFFLTDTADSFHFAKECFWKLGLPRNDLFFETHPELSGKVHNQYRISKEKRLAMFAPTFRRGMHSDTYGLDFGQLKMVLAQRFGGEWEILFRNHCFVQEEQKFVGQCVDVSDYEDMQELLYVSDVLVSDYSSCMWDFALTGRPCFSYVPDLEEYKNHDRTLACPIEEWPYSIAQNNRELYDNILHYHERDYQEKVQQHLHEKGSFDHGNAAVKIAEVIGKSCL